MFADVINVVLAIVLLFVGVTEWVLVYRLKKLEVSMHDIDKDFQAVRIEASAIKDKISLLYSYLKTLGSGKVKISGDVPMFGKLDLDLELGKKEVDSDAKK